MRKSFRRILSLALVVFLVCGMVMPSLAATYRPGAQSGPSSSYAGGMYYANYKRVPITGDNRTDLIAIALSQLGYQEGASNGSFSGEVSGRANYVEFSYNLGDLGLGYGGTDYPWCASFVTWCLYQSHCTDQATYKDLGRFHNGDYKYIWKEISCSQWVRQLKGAGYYKYSAYQGGSYTPKSGDLVFFQNSGGVAHIGICLYTSGGRIYTVEGNTSDSAGLEPNGGGVYFKNYSLSTSYINGYGVLPYVSKSVAKIDYSGSNPTPGLYVANASKYIYASETASSHSWVMDRFTMFEVTEVCSNGRLKVTAVERGGSTVTGYVSNNSDRVIQLSTTATDGTDTARSVLQGVIKDVQGIRHYNYTEEVIAQIRTAYNEAVALVANTSATEAQLVASAATLRNLMGTTGVNTIAQNNQGIYVNGRNGVIKAGDCFIYSPTWNDGLITVDNANIRYTLNVVCGWDAERMINVVKSISVGTGSSTPAIQLGEAEFLIACHDWETGIADSDDPVEYSGTNYAILSSLSVGDGIRLSGVTALNANSDVEPAAFLKFIPKDAVRLSGENCFADSGQGVMFTPDFNGGLLTAENANINNTLNVLAQWDNDRSAWVVADKFSGTSGDIQLSDDQVLFACHKGTSTAESYYWNKLDTAKVGQQVNFSGISPTDGANRLSVAANISFTDLVTPEEPEDTVTLSNLTLNQAYTVQNPGTAAHTADLTDGIYVDALDTTGGWFGFVCVPESANYNTDENGIGYVTMDLGKQYALDTFKAHVFAGENSASIAPPAFIDLYTSNNGTDYAYAGSMTMDASASASYWAALEGAGVTGRYVKFAVGPSGNSAWVFLNEVEVWGTELTGVENIALGTNQVTTGSSYTGNMVDGIIGSEITDGSWYGIDTTAGSGSAIINLGSRYQITGVQAHIYAGADLAAPGVISVSTSADGSNYMKIGELPLDAEAAAAYWAAISSDTSVGQYVKLTAESDAGLVLISELQVFGTPYVSSGDTNIAMGKDTVVTGYDGSPFNALLNDGLASEVFQYNVNNSAWFAFKNPENVTISNTETGEGRGIITIDLGGQAEITDLSIHLFGGTNDAGAVQPGYINTYYSTDGAEFIYQETLTPDPTQEGAYWLKADYTDAPVTARYVKLAVGTNSGDLVLLNEIKVGGLMLTQDEPNEPGSLSSVVLAGDFNNWNPTPNMRVVDDQKVSTTMRLEAGSYEFKILYNGEWFGNSGTIVDTTGDTPWVMDHAASNCVMTASRTGDYVFIFNRDTKELTVTYVPDTLYLRGSFNDWGTVLPMTTTDNETYQATVVLEAGSHEFKVANEDYSGQWPSNNYVLNLDRKSSVTVSLETLSNTLTVTYASLEGLVTFLDWDGTELDSQLVALGEMPTVPADPVRASDESYSYTFAGWDKTVTAVAGDVSYTAVYEATALITPPTLKPSFPTLTFEDVITMNVYFTASDLTDVVEMGLITYSSSVTDYSVETAQKVIPGYRFSDTYQMYVVSTEGIAAKDMSDEIFFAVYAKLADGSYSYSALLSYSPTSYAYTLLDTADDSVKQLMVAMLNYGAEAQTFFSYRTEAPMNAGLTDAQKASIESYRVDMMDSVSTVDAAKAVNFTRTASGFTSRYPSISFEGAFEINYYCVPSATVQGNLTLYYWNQADYDSAEVLSVDNATGVIAMTEGADRYEAAVTGIAAKDLDKGVYVAFVYSDGTADYCSGILGYSIGAYCVDQGATGAAIAPFAQATAVYGYYAKQLFYTAA